jgi:hypothetical protein
MDPYTALTAEWIATAGGHSARQEIRSWAAFAPRLAGFATPAELVAAIGQPGHADRSCALLADLLRLAGDDRLAGRAVLQAVLPGLRAAASRRWYLSSPSGPWSSPHGIATDAISVGWEAILRHGGQHHARPAAVLIRDVEGRLRRIHRRWHSETARTDELTDRAVELDLLPAEAHTPEHHATTLIADALSSGVIDSQGAVLLVSVGVLGYSVAETERHLRTTPGSAYRHLNKARTALRTWPGLDIPLIPSPHPQRDSPPPDTSHFECRRAS